MPKWRKKVCWYAGMLVSDMLVSGMLVASMLVSGMLVASMLVVGRYLILAYLLPEPRSGDTRGGTPRLREG